MGGRPGNGEEWHFSVAASPPGCPSHVLGNSVYLEGSLFFISPYLMLASRKGQARSIMLSINESYL